MLRCLGCLKSLCFLQASQVRSLIRQVVIPLDDFGWDQLQNSFHEVVIPLGPERVYIVSWRLRRHWRGTAGVELADSKSACL